MFNKKNNNAHYYLQLFLLISAVFYTYDAEKISNPEEFEEIQSGIHNNSINNNADSEEINSTIPENSTIPSVPDLAQRNLFTANCQNGYKQIGNNCYKTFPFTN